jgi:branched-chain amino acid transport system ATP-binding protein
MAGELTITDLSVSYRQARAVQKVTAVGVPGKVTAVVGANGAGKSSLLLAVYGSVPSTGKVTLDGAEIGKMNPAHRVRAGVAIVPQGRQLFPRLTVRENLKVMADVLHLGSDDVGAAIERFPRLGERVNQLAGVLSGGEQQMLVVTRALMGDPKVLLLDEMATGLSPLVSQQLMAEVCRLAGDGLTVLLAAPAITTVAGQIDRGYVMRRGELVATVESGGRDLDERYRESMGLLTRAAALDTA